jgi:glycosyltransferase involved in cell wall biosynthesis
VNASTLSEVHVVLPNDIDDPAAPSGGNGYDRHVCRELAALGWSVGEHAVYGPWPHPGPAERADLARVLAVLPDGAPVLLDGLVASAVPEVLVPEADRLRLVVLVHMPLDTGSEQTALAAASAVVTTSAWSRGRLLDRYGLPAGRVHVATPGVEPAPLAPASEPGTRLLCVAAVAPHKGHDVLVEALATLPSGSCTCTCVGSLTRDPEFAARIRATGLVRLVGPRTGDALAAAYADADLLVLPSRGETYGMVVTEALARGIPVLASDVYGLPEALGHAPDGSAPGLLVPPGDAEALAGALRRWLTGPELRHRLRRAARERRDTLTGWAVTARTIAGVLGGVPA